MGKRIDITAMLVSNLKRHGLDGLGAYHVAREIINANRIRDNAERRGKMNNLLRATPLAAWFKQVPGAKRDAIEIRWGAQVVVRLD